MFNNTSSWFKNSIIIGLLVILSSCKKDKTLDISDYEYANGEIAVIEINIPKAEGKSTLAKTINTAITNFTCDVLHIDAGTRTETTIEGSAEAFNTSYTNFKNQLDENLLGELPNWEVFVDGELSYQNELVISFAMSSTINTGGVKPITQLSFLNFDKATGKLLDYDDLISDKANFKTVLKSYLVKELNSSSFTLDDFKTDNGALKNPDHLGYNESGLILFYQTPNNDFIECLIPFTKVNKYLAY